MIGEMIRKMLTEKDNLTHCPVRVGAVGTGVVYHLSAAWMVFGQHTHLDMALLGQYIAHMIELFGATAVAVGAKSKLDGDAPAGSAS